MEHYVGVIIPFSWIGYESGYVLPSNTRLAPHCGIRIAQPAPTFGIGREGKMPFEAQIFLKIRYKSTLKKPLKCLRNFGTPCSAIVVLESWLERTSIFAQGKGGGGVCVWSVCCQWSLAGEDGHRPLECRVH